MKKGKDLVLPEPVWTVFYNKKTLKSLNELPQIIVDISELLREELAFEGPVQSEWPNYSQFKKQKGQPRSEKRYHCHLKKGNPTYVACWKVVGKEIEIEIYYVGVHGRAPF